MTQKDATLVNSIGCAIYPFVKRLVGRDRAGRVVSKLLEQSLEDYKYFTANHSNFTKAVTQADESISNAIALLPKGKIQAKNVGPKMVRQDNSPKVYREKIK